MRGRGLSECGHLELLDLQVSCPISCSQMITSSQRNSRETLYTRQEQGTCGRPSPPLSALWPPIATIREDSAPRGRLRARAPCEAPLVPPFRLGEGAGARASESGAGGRKSRITCSSCSAISGALTHRHLHRLESPVSPEAEAPGKGERVHWIKHVTRVGQ